MADPFVGGIVKLGIDPGMEGHLAHENKKGNHGQAVFGKGVPDHRAQHMETRFKGHEKAEPGKPDQGHGHTHRHPQEEQDREQNDDA
jgi:hypothetical protein